MLVIAHRGASGTEPENTIRSFKKAEELNVDMIEMDVRESKDGELVIFHDHSLKRLFGIDKAVVHMNLADLKAISIGREIPTLDEVLAQVHTDLNLEIKVHGIEAKVLNKIKNFPHKVLISSFYPEILKEFRTLDGNIRLALIIGIKRFHMIALARYFAKKLDLYSIHPKFSIVSAPIMALLRLAKRKIYVWVPNSQNDYERMKKLGVDGIFTDYPEMFRLDKNFFQDTSADAD